MNWLLALFLGILGLIMIGVGETLRIEATTMTFLGFPDEWILRIAGILVMLVCVVLLRYFENRDQNVNRRV